MFLKQSKNSRKAEWRQWKRKPAECLCQTYDVKVHYLHLHIEKLKQDYGNDADFAKTKIKFEACKMIMRRNCKTFEKHSFVRNLEETLKREVKDLIY